jgi:hypothetical protein
MQTNATVQATAWHSLANRLLGKRWYRKHNEETVMKQNARIISSGCQLKINLG